MTDFGTDGKESCNVDLTSELALNSRAAAMVCFMSKSAKPTVLIGKILCRRYA
ncbi:MAG: hypothetical protein ACLR6O_00215 [Eubacterium sp.]